MAHVRIHHGDPANYVKTPNDTARWPRLGWAARGYLTEMLSNEPGWEPESQEQAVRRARRERGDEAETAGQVRRIHAQLEREGFRHRLRFSTGRGTMITEIHYYAWPALPCEDPGHCAVCKARGVPPVIDPPESAT